MKLSRTYQSTLSHQRWNTNIIHSSWSLVYKDEYVCGARYNGVEILSVCFPCGLQVFSKSLEVMKKYVRAYKAGRLEV